MIRRSPWFIADHGGRIWRIRWWNTWLDPLTGRQRWGWIGWHGTSVRDPGHLLAHLCRLSQP